MKTTGLPLTSSWFRLFPVRSPLLGKSRLISFPPGTKMVHFPRFASLSGYPGINRDGLPHSGIPGSKPAYGSPRLFAVRHALHRLSVPRHPPYTLTTLNNKFTELSPDKPNTATLIEKSKNTFIYTLLCSTLPTGEYRDRTGDLRRAKPTLSQLS